MMFKVIMYKKESNIFMEEYTRETEVFKTNSFLKANRKLNEEYDRIKAYYRMNYSDCTKFNDEDYIIKCWGGNGTTITFDLIID